MQPGLPGPDNDWANRQTCPRREDPDPESATNRNFRAEIFISFILIYLQILLNFDTLKLCSCLLSLFFFFFNSFMLSSLPTVSALENCNCISAVVA